MIRFGLRFLIANLFLCALPTTALLAEMPTKAVDTLNQSYVTASKIEGRERISYLVRLSKASSSFAPPQTLGRWCEELFSLASASPLDWDHVANQKNAAQNLATVDPDHAMDLLARVDLPQPQDGIFAEDVRAYSAVTIFPSFLRSHGLSALPAIQRQAHHIGDTGEYPYRAMGIIISDLLALNQETARSQAATIFREAVSYYARPSQFKNKDEEFLDLLATGPSLAIPDVYRAGLEAFVNHVSSAPAEEGVFAADVKTAQGGIIRLKDLHELLLWRVFPLVVDLDSTWAHELINLHPDLVQAQHNVELLGAHQIYGNPPAQSIQSRQHQMLEQALLSKIVDISASDSQAALEAARHLTTPARIAAFSAVLPSLIDSDRKKAQEVYNQQLVDLKSLTTSSDRFRTLVPTAKSAYFVQDLKTFSALTTEILDTGSALFEKDIMKPRADLRNGYREMAAIVAFSAEHNFDWVLNKLKRTKNPLLKAHLLIFAAQGFAEAEHGSLPTSQTASK